MCSRPRGTEPTSPGNMRVVQLCPPCNLTIKCVVCVTFLLHAEDFSKAASQQQPVNTGRAQEHGRKVKRRRGDAVGQPAAASEPAPPHLQQQLQDQPAGMQGDDVLSQDPYKHLPQGLRQWRQRYQPHTLPHTAVTQIDTPSSSAHGQSDTASVHAPRHPGTADSPGSTEYVPWIVRATAFVHAPWLYPCGGHTHVTIETEVASVPLGCPGDELESRVRFMIAKVFGVRPEEVGVHKVLLMKQSYAFSGAECACGFAGLWVR